LTTSSPSGRAHAADVFAFDLEARVHHRVGQLAVGGEQQQAGGVDVEAADRDPARALQRGQRLEDGRPAFRVFAGGDLAFRLVVDQHARRIDQRARDEGLAVQLDLVAAGDAHAGARDLAVDLDQAVGDALLQRAARAQAGLRQHLVQAFLDARCSGGFRRGLCLQAQRAAGGFVFLAHCFCSDDAGFASSPGWSVSVSMSPMDSALSVSMSVSAMAGEVVSSSEPLLSDMASAAMSSWSCSCSMSLSSPGMVSNPVAAEVEAEAAPAGIAAANGNCGSSSPRSRNSDSGGSSSSRFRPK
jgi:hypothetical protein